MISAKIIADSRNTFGDRITTFVLVFPRIVLAEFNTHRMLSKNSASSRAIPTKKMLKMVKEAPFIPKAWMKEHTGMQGNEYYSKEEKFSIPELTNIMQERLMKIYDTEDGDNPELMEIFDKMVSEFELFSSYTLDEFWLIIRDKIVNCALLLTLLGVSKQIVNRLLEPFMWHTVIVTGTDWENFFALRAHPAAEIHIAELAEKMLEAYNESESKLLKPGEWHIPFLDTIDFARLRNNFTMIGAEEDIHQQELGMAVKIATARCARISYLTFEGKDDYTADISMHDKLLKDGHMSPFEHCAYAMNPFERNNIVPVDGFVAVGYSGNFRGFVQYRKTLQGENKKDSRVKKALV